jgi:hypothetical protein
VAAIELHHEVGPVGWPVLHQRDEIGEGGADERRVAAVRPEVLPQRGKSGRNPRQYGLGLAGRARQAQHAIAMLKYRRIDRDPAT